LHPKKTSVYLPIGEIKKVTRQRVNELKSFEKSNILRVKLKGLKTKSDIKEKSLKIFITMGACFS